MRTQAHTSSRRTQAGASLLEVLIAVLILAIGLLGIAALQSLTLKNTQSSSERTAAIIQSYAMLDMMRANRDQAIARNYDTGWLCAAPENPGSKVVSGAAGDGGVDENAAASPASIGRRGSDAEPAAHPVVSGCA